jgi:peroxiredoxin
MRRTAWIATVTALAAGGLWLASPSWADKPDDVDKLNTKISSFTLDHAGKPWSLDSVRDRKAVVVVFLSFDCPVSNSYASTLTELYRKHEDKGVAFVAVNSSDDLSTAELAKQAAEFKLPFPVLMDDRFKVADLFQAKVAPEAFVLDHNRVLRYRGRIDNAYSARLKKNPRTTEHDLDAAVADVLAGKHVRTPATKAVGCPIVRERVVKKDGAVTYHRDVLPILQNQCQQCHRPGEVGPFSLMTYKQAVNWAHDIKEYTQDRRMPPWKAVEGGPFHNERKLSDKELATLAAWVDGGTPEGDPKDAPPPVKFTDGWQLGTPDLILTMPEEMTVGPSGKDIFRAVVLPTGLTEDKYVIGVEVRPGNPRILHHTLNFFDTTGQARALEKKEKDRAKKPNEQDFGPGYPSTMGIGFTPVSGKVGGVGGWAPGQRPRFLPKGYGYPLPKGSDLVVQMHYHRNGRTEADKTSIGLYFAKDTNLKRYKSGILPGRFLVIPAGAEKFKVNGSIEALEDGELHSVMHHMHMLGKTAKVTMTPPGGEPKTLLRIDDWDYNWQETYFLKEPIAFKAGTKFAVEATYDNSAKNPNNPFSPPTWVRFGDQTDQEMCFVFLGVTNNTDASFKFKGDAARLLRR